MDNKIIIDVLESQYRAALRTLRTVIGKTPEELWNDTGYNNPNWQIAYHILWSAKFYLSASPESFRPWPDAIIGAESLGGSEDWENPDEGVVVEGYHTQEEILAFIDDIENNLLQTIEFLPLEEYSGFVWYPYSRMELHINTIRHIQHHTAQLIERLKAKGINGFAWVADRNPPMAWNEE